MDSVTCKQRESWIDNAKFFAIVMVMFAHCSASFFENEPGRLWVHHLIQSSMMPLFFFLSGVTSYKRVTDLSTLGGGK